jgi:type VI secretion system protein ImpF
MSVRQRLTPTLFDKLVADIEISGLRDQQGETQNVSHEAMRFYSVPRIERFNEAALRATIRRDLAWLLNTTNLGAIRDLAPYPQVATSVLNYGVPDLAGKSLHRRTILHRAREIRDAIRAFETRLEPESLVVEPTGGREGGNSVTFLIHGDVSSAAKVMPVQFRTELEADTASVDVSE